MSRKAAKINPNDLLNKVQHAISVSKNTYGFTDWSTGPLKKVLKDISKIQLDVSLGVNTDCSNLLNPQQNRLDRFIGPQNYNGLSFIGCYSETDCIIETYFIIYWDGKDLRGYVPKNGNIWNYDNKTQFDFNDSDEQEDYDFITKKLPKILGVKSLSYTIGEFEDLENIVRQMLDVSKMLKEIDNRIKVI